MRGLGLLDLLVIMAVVGLLIFAGTREFHRYDQRSAAPASPPTAPPP